MFHQKEKDEYYKTSKNLTKLIMYHSYAKRWPTLRSIGAEGANT